ncbi:pheromone-binding protein 1-like [Chironomus tepperi]|uniref:pheromone-binding protein 1-like n=1 Tax=Chironomus tepperi TaxID=113505 RepID=UPI00391EF689
MKFILIVLMAFVAIASCKSPDEYMKHMKASFEKCKSEMPNLPDLSMFKPSKLGSIPQDVKCMLNCVMEEMGFIKKDTVDVDKFFEMTAGKMDADADMMDKLKDMLKECAAIADPDRCTRGSDIFHCLKSAAEKAGLKCDEH